jgi:hypothetical protein
MAQKKTAQRPQSQPKHPRAIQESGLIATRKHVRHSAGPKAALDNHSHRTHEVQLRSACSPCALTLKVV